MLQLDGRIGDQRGSGAGAGPGAAQSTSRCRGGSHMPSVPEDAHHRPTVTRSVRKLLQRFLRLSCHPVLPPPSSPSPFDLGHPTLCATRMFLPEICFPNVSNLQDDRKSNCHHKKATMITFRPRFRLEATRDHLPAGRFTGQSQSDRPTEFPPPAFEARLIPCGQPSSTITSS